MNKYSNAAYKDTALLQLIRKGEEPAFTELFYRYWQSLYEKANTILRNPAVSKDIVQDVFYSIWVRRAELDIQSVKAYLEQAVRFQVFKAIRDHKAGLQMQERLTAVTVDIMEDDPLLFKEHQELLEYLISKLPEDYREAFRLSRQDQLSYKEISQRLQISERSVEHRIAKSLEFFRTHYRYDLLIVMLMVTQAGKLL
ncbi:MAG: sigma-70 family RNA polymerase sigma factor [Bacteroidota bacterium]